jgi:hypothetical protein
MRRRTKAIIADQLPRKRDNIVFCQLSELQLRAYRRMLQVRRLGAPPRLPRAGLHAPAARRSRAPRLQGCSVHLPQRLPLAADLLLPARLQSPDYQLLARAPEPCDCGSELPRAKCCHTMVRSAFSQGASVPPNWLPVP